MDYPKRGFDYVNGFFSDIDTNIVVVFESCYLDSDFTLVNSVNECNIDQSLDFPRSGVSGQNVFSRDIFSNIKGGNSTSVVDNLSFWQGRSGLVHSVNNAIDSICDVSTINGRVPQGYIKKRKHEEMFVQSALLRGVREERKGGINKESSIQEAEKVESVGKRLFWMCSDLGSYIREVKLCKPMIASTVKGFVLLQCDNMSDLPLYAKGCCFIYSFDGICKFGVIEKFLNVCLEYRKYKEGSLLLHEKIHKIDTSQLIKSYKFNFVNVFHSNIALMKEKFLHHCLVNKLGYLEGMLKPSIHVDAAPSSEFLSNSEI